MERLKDVSSVERHLVRVLVVDDYEDSAQCLAMLLRLYRHEVNIALSGRDAIQQARSSKPDVVLLDLSMPIMDGYQVARRLRQTYGDDITLIALTANGSNGDRERSTEAGFDFHLTKPTDPRKLEAMLVQLEEVLL